MTLLYEGVVRTSSIIISGISCFATINIGAIPLGYKKDKNKYQHFNR